MISYLKSDIVGIYNDLIRSASLKYKKGKFVCALNDISTAANWAYNFNHIYTDTQAENLLKQISDVVIEPVTISHPKTDHFILLDSFLWDNHGLTQQYLRSMMASGIHVLVIYTRKGGNVGRDIQVEIEAYDKGEIRQYYNVKDEIEMARQIVQDIANFQPSRIFLHLTPWDLTALMACYAIKGIIKYQINLTDHAYWMGASFVDYVFEFRPYGFTVSQEKRFLRQEQLLLLPFYPIVPFFSHYDGLPDLPSDAVIVLSGGAPYKMLGKNNIFFQIMEHILRISPNVYILVAGFVSDSHFDEQVAKIEGCERVLQIGIRHDINAVFDHCDIYLGTYPMMGGLMTQYAALHSKPVVAYHEKDDVMNATEEMVNFYQHDYQSFTDIEEMTAYAERLVKDLKYRHEQGQLLHDGMMNAERFNDEFVRIMQSNHSNFEWKKDQINYEHFFERYLELENSNGFSATRKLLRVQRLGSFVKIKHCRWKLIFILLYVIKANVTLKLFGRFLKRQFTIFV